MRSNGESTMNTPGITSNYDDVVPKVMEYTTGLQ